MIGVLLLDFSKAFDSVCHQTLLKKLQAMGIAGEIFQWCRSYLTDRKQFTTIDGSSSHLAAVEQGVPQGSLLGPRFYSYHANDLPDVVSNSDQLKSCFDNFNGTELFADDTTVFCSAFNLDELTQKLQMLSNHMLDWSKKNGMVIHPGKNKVMIITRKPYMGPPQNVTMDGRSLEFVEKYKVLGVTIDCKLSWNDHIKDVTRYFNIKVKRLKRMLTLDKSTLTNFYFKVIIPATVYNISVWGNVRPNKLNGLNEIHAEACRIIQRFPANLSHDKCLQKAKWLPLSYLYKRRILCLMQKVYYNSIDSSIVSFFKLTNNTRYTSRRQHQLVSSNTTIKNTFIDRGLKIWNIMPNELTSIESYLNFKSQLILFKDKINKFSFEYNSFNITNDYKFI